MKLVCVSGVSRGLGLAITRYLLEEGYHVIGLSRSESKDVKDLLKKHDKQFCFKRFDLSSDSPSALVKKINGEHGHLYGLINNAALGLDGVLATMHDKQISEVIQVNLTGAIQLTKYAVRSMLLNRHKAGRIVNISSIIANTGFNGLSVYAASKAGLVGFTRSLARELGKANITVNAVLPGYMETDMTGRISAADLEAIKRRSPMKALVSPDDVAGAVSYLLSDKARRVSGTTVVVDAGSSA